MPDLEVLDKQLDLARAGLNRAKNAMIEWRRGKVQTVNFTTGQKTALKSEFLLGLAAAEDAMAAINRELI